VQPQTPNIIWVRHGALREDMGPYEVRVLLHNPAKTESEVTLVAQLPDAHRPVRLSLRMPGERYLSLLLFLKTTCLKRIIGDYGVIVLLDKDGNIVDQKAFEITSKHPPGFKPQVLFSKKSYRPGEPVLASIVDLPLGTDIITLMVTMLGNPGYIGFIDQLTPMNPPYNYTAWIRPFIPLGDKPGTYIMRARIWSWGELVATASGEFTILKG